MKIAIVSDSNSGITQVEAKKLGITIIPMPFTIEGEEYYEDINLTQEDFYEKLLGDVSVSTSQPSIGYLMNAWDNLLEEYDQIVFIPMSSGLSKTYDSANRLAEQDYPNKVFVVNNQRISVTLRQSVLDAMELAASNYIFQNYAKPYYVPEGHEKKKLKRYGGLTEHITPLPEGIPPKSDKTRVESLTLL